MKRLTWMILGLTAALAAGPIGKVAAGCEPAQSGPANSYQVRTGTEPCDIPANYGYKQTVELLTRQGLTVADRLCSTGNYSEAAFLLEKILRLNPDCAEAHNMLARLQKCQDVAAAHDGEFVTDLAQWLGVRQPNSMDCGQTIGACTARTAQAPCCVPTMPYASDGETPGCVAEFVGDLVSGVFLRIGNATECCPQTPSCCSQSGGCCATKSGCATVQKSDESKCCCCCGGKCACCEKSPAKVKTYTIQGTCPVCPAMAGMFAPPMPQFIPPPVPPIPAFQFDAGRMAVIHQGQPMPGSQLPQNPTVIIIVVPQTPAGSPESVHTPVTKPVSFGYPMPMMAPPAPCTCCPTGNMAVLQYNVSQPTQARQTNANCWNQVSEAAVTSSVPCSDSRPMPGLRLISHMVAPLPLPMFGFEQFWPVDKQTIRQRDMTPVPFSFLPVQSDW